MLISTSLLEMKKHILIIGFVVVICITQLYLCSSLSLLKEHALRLLLEMNRPNGIAWLPFNRKLAIYLTPWLFVFPSILIIVTTCVIRWERIPILALLFLEIVIFGCLAAYALNNLVKIFITPYHWLGG